MKIVTDKARLGRFYLVRRVQGNMEILKTTEGFDTYEDAEAQMAQVKPASMHDELLILQVAAEYRIRSTFVEVHPK